MSLITYPGLIASDFLVTDEMHSWKVWLWESQEDLIRWADLYSVNPQKEPGYYDKTMALHSPCKSLVVNGPMQHLGDLHFVKDHWNMMMVTHELLHALFHYIRGLVPDFSRAFYGCWIEEEEELCYPFGEWCEWVYRWLWKKNPNPKRGNQIICDK